MVERERTLINISLKNANQFQGTVFLQKTTLDGKLITNEPDEFQEVLSVM